MLSGEMLTPEKRLDIVHQYGDWFVENIKLRIGINIKDHLFNQFILTD